MSKNRDTESMLTSMTIQDNVVLPSLDNLREFGFFITPRSERAMANGWCKKLNVKMRDLDQSCAEFSGGNKQKIVLAKLIPFLGLIALMVFFQIVTRENLLSRRNMMLIFNQDYALFIRGVVCCPAACGG
jgi:ABC-type uncharacterized transport system ATPase subunit